MISWWVYRDTWRRIRHRLPCLPTPPQFWLADCTWPASRICKGRQFWSVLWTIPQPNQRWSCLRSILICGRPWLPIRCPCSFRRTGWTRWWFRFGSLSAEGRCRLSWRWLLRFFSGWWPGGHLRLFGGLCPGRWWGWCSLPSRLGRRDLRLI